MKRFSLFLFLLAALQAHSQPATEIYLFDLATKGNTIRLLNPRNISNNPGAYDNQPSFLPDGKSLLFASSRDGQTDILKYTASTSQKTYLTSTPASEFSPTPTPDGMAFTTIGLEVGGRQLLWKFPLETGQGSILVPFLKIGYHVWFSPDTLYTFVLGPHTTLQEISLSSQRAEILAENIGRSLHKVPGRPVLSYVDKSSEEWMITLYDPSTQTHVPLAAALPGSEDYCWLNDGSLLMAQQNTLYHWQPDKKEWKAIADLSHWGLASVTRLATSPDGSLLALVVTE